MAFQKCTTLIKKCIFGFLAFPKSGGGPCLGKCWLGADAEEVQKAKTYRRRVKNYYQKHLQYLSKLLNTIDAINSIGK